MTTLTQHERTQRLLYAKIRYRDYLETVLRGETPKGFKPATNAYVSEVTFSIMEVEREIRQLQEEGGEG